MSDTPRVDAAAEKGSDLGPANRLASGIWQLARDLERELSACNAELERERMRLAACGIVAMANTPESAIKARSMDNDYRSASCEDVANAVDEQMRLRAELARAMRVVNAAKTYKDDDSHDDTRSLNLLLDAVEKWEAGQ